MDLNKWRRLKRNGGYRRRVSKKYFEMKSVSEFGSSGSKEKFLNKKEPGEVGEVCDGSVHGKMEIDLDNWEDNFTESCNDQEDTENDSGSINSEFNDSDHIEFDKNYELQMDIKQWAIRNNIGREMIIIRKMLAILTPKKSWYNFVIFP